MRTFHGLNIPLNEDRFLCALAENIDWRNSVEKQYLNILYTIEALNSSASFFISVATIIISMFFTNISSLYFVAILLAISTVCAERMLFYNRGLILVSDTINLLVSMGGSIYNIGFLPILFEITPIVVALVFKAYHILIAYLAYKIFGTVIKLFIFNPILYRLTGYVYTSYCAFAVASKICMVSKKEFIDAYKK